MAYHVKLDAFEGPLDLFLYLIKKNQIDIYDIPMAQITKEYLEYIEVMKLLDIDVIGEFLVMAATLIKIKSRMLLPSKEVEETEKEIEDPRIELVRQLAEYQKYREAAGYLEEMETKQREIFVRPLAEEPMDEAWAGRLGVGLFDLLTALKDILIHVSQEKSYDIEPQTVTLQEKMAHILRALRGKSRIKFWALFDVCLDKPDLIVTFLALLELIRSRKVWVRQSSQFGEIIIAKA
jgi:segregation and condensation protein A